ncbi:MAG TPA: CUAEP/CCAEP-tail radical SAM protein [Candidatus Acidoferrales bacterium]|nr:CUAEP/CCAEP-tail radical SAM protein [Candidatus Acidoferrales bacterium]
MKAVLISTYELGRQPFGLASPAAWLREVGVEVTCTDTSRECLNERAIRDAALVGFYVPMHTATRLAVQLLGEVQRISPDAHICFYGLYAPVNEAWLRQLGVQTILGGEFEEGLAHLANRLADGQANATQEEPVVSLSRQAFKLPSRDGLAPLSKYARVALPDGQKLTAGYTETSRGCKHRCRHCPIVPVYNGVFRVVGQDVVLADIRQQVAAGAQHITFGDPDFFNGIGHAVPLVEALHEEFPKATYDVTIKIEHLLKHSEYLRTLRETGCLFVTSAVESVDDAILEKLDKHHTRADFLEVVRRFRAERLVLQPTFLPFTPWTTAAGYLDLLEMLRRSELIENVAPIQLAIRLLIPVGSRLLELDEIRANVGRFDQAAMVYPWKHADKRVDDLSEEVQRIVHVSEKMSRTRTETFALIERAARQAAGVRVAEIEQPILPSRATIPYLTEPWYC